MKPIKYVQKMALLAALLAPGAAQAQVAFEAYVDVPATTSTVVYAYDQAVYVKVLDIEPAVGGSTLCTFSRVGAATANSPPFKAGYVWVGFDPPAPLSIAIWCPVTTRITKFWGNY